MDTQDTLISKIRVIVRERIWKRCIGKSNESLCPVCQSNTITKDDFSIVKINTSEKLEFMEVWLTGDETNLAPVCNQCNTRIGCENLYEYTRTNYKRKPIFKGIFENPTNELLP